MSEPRGRDELAREGGGRPRLLDVRLIGPPELVEEALAALRLVLDVSDVSKSYPTRGSGPGRVYLKALGVSPEARRFLHRRPPLADAD